MTKAIKQVHPVGEVLDFGISDFDPFSDEALADPFSFHQNLRDRGPLLWLQKYDIWCAARYEDIKKILIDHGNFSSAGGAGLPIRRCTSRRTVLLFGLCLQGQ